MGTSLNGLTPSATYSGLIKFGDNSAIGVSLKYISDGDGNDTLLAMSTTSLNIGATNISARLGIKGSGSTSATTSLLVQNSAGSTAMQITDDRIVKVFNGLDLSGWYLYLNGTGAAKISGGDSLTFEIVNSGNYQFSQTSESNGRVSIGKNSAADASAKLEIVSTTRGFLPPRMTTTQKNAIATPAAGLVVYDTTTNKLCCYNGSTWNDLF